MRPPQNPREWFDNLPEAPVEVHESVYAVFKGSIEGVTNQIVELLDGNGLRIVNGGSQRHWVFNYELGICEINNTVVADLVQKIIRETGRDYTYRPAVLLDSITIWQVKYALYPA